MNLIFHLLSGVLITKILLPNPDIMAYILMIIASIVTDFDHINLVSKAFKTKRFGVESRSRFHELYGLAIGLILLSLLSPFINIASFLMIAFSFHYIADYLTRPTRPFYPLKKEVCHFNLYPTSLRWIIIFDTILTGGLACVIYLMM